MSVERTPWTAHGKYKTRIYRIYIGMKQRCYNENCPSYDRYGGRGITVCDEWRGRYGFHHFYDWSMENGYTDELSIDRIDNDGNYSPKNCRWVDRFVQNNNFSRNRNYTYNGETHSLSVWGRIRPNGLNYETLRSRLRDGWSVEKAFSEPYHTREKDTEGNQITIDGETHNISTWCKITCIDKCTFYRRINRGWDEIRAIIEPAHKQHIRKDIRSKNEL